MLEVVLVLQNLFLLKIKYLLLQVRAYLLQLDNLLIFLMGSFYNGFQTSYDINGTDLGGYSEYDRLNSSAGNMGSSIKDGETITTSDVPYIDGMITTLKSLIDLPNTINTIMNKIGTETKLPSYVIPTINTMIVVLIGFGIGSIIWRWEM